MSLNVHTVACSPAPRAPGVGSTEPSRRAQRDHPAASPSPQRPSGVSLAVLGGGGAGRVTKGCGKCADCDCDRPGGDEHGEHLHAG